MSICTRARIRAASIANLAPLEHTRPEKSRVQELTCHDEQIPGRGAGIHERLSTFLSDVRVASRL